MESGCPPRPTSRSTKGRAVKLFGHTGIVPRIPGALTSHLPHPNPHPDSPAYIPLPPVERSPQTDQPRQPKTATPTHLPYDIPHPNISDRLPLQGLPHLLKSRRVPPHVPDKNDDAVPLSRLFDRVALRERLRHGFLDEDMFAGVGAGYDLGGVELVGGEDEDDVQGNAGGEEGFSGGRRGR